MERYDVARVYRGYADSWAGNMGEISNNGAVGTERIEDRTFKLLVEGIEDYSIFMLNPAGHVTNWNKGAERIKGYREEEIKGAHFSRFFTPEDQAADAPSQVLRSALAHGRFASEGWRVRKDGARFFASVVVTPLHENGAHVGFATITRNITEREEAQSRVAASETQFQRLVLGVTDYALYMLSPLGIVENWNAGGERIKGYSRAEIVGQHFSRFYTPEDRAADKPSKALNIALEQGHYEEEGWRVRKDGSFLWASVVIDPIRDEDGNLVGFAKITRDISERKKAEDELAKVQRQLAEAQKLDALGHLTGGVAHDFNNLLMIVDGSLHRLRQEVTSDKGVRALRSIEIASNRASTLTRQLLTFSRRQSVRPQRIDVRASVNDLSDILRSGLGNAIALNNEVPPDTPEIFVDPTEFETALVNLVINARDAMPEGGAVTVSATTTQPDMVEISVSDSGVGIPPDIAEKVFDPFFTTKEVGKGTGLGLSQVHGFVHQAGGNISLHSVLGKGTTFRIILPCATESATPDRSPNAEPSEGGGVLLVEDHPEVAEATSSLLEQLGYSVRWVSSASDALTELGKCEYDIVCSDVVMPGQMDGADLARAVRQKYPNLPVLLMTGYSRLAPDIMRDFSVLRKPFQIHELSAALKTAATRESRAIN